MYYNRGFGGRIENVTYDEHEIIRAYLNNVSSLFTRLGPVVTFTL